MRLFSPLSGDALAEQVRRDLNVDHVRRVGLVATRGPTPEIVAHASYAAIDGDHAEVAFAVADPWQGRGIATILLGQLAGIAAGHQIHTFQALVLPENQRMIEVFREAGFAVQLRYTGWEVLVTFPTSLTEEALSRFEQRDQLAAAERDAREMIADLKIARVPAGTRGRRPADVDALTDVIVRVAALVEEYPQIVELDCNPVIVHERGATIVDARVRIAPVEAPSLLGRPRVEPGELG